MLAGISSLPLCFALVLAQAHAATAVLTRSYDNGRTGANTSETALTPNVVANGLIKVKSLAIGDDPRIEAQPLYVPGLVMARDGKAHNVVFVATMGNHVYAFDADAGEGHDLLWRSPLLGRPFPPGPDPENPPPATSVERWGINVRWGILSTPVIDLDAQQMYIVNWVASQNAKSALLYLHRIRLSDGQEIGVARRLRWTLRDARGRPVLDARGAPVSLRENQRQRAALLLTPLSGKHKTLFIGVAGGESSGSAHGWLLAVDVDTFRQSAAFPTTRQGFGGGIWQGAQGPSSDDHGHIFAMTGNGGYNARESEEDKHPGKAGDFNGTTDFAEAFLKLNYHKDAAGRASLTLEDWFIPFQDLKRSAPQGELDYQDQDLGSAAPVLPPGTSLLLGAGKDGILYVLDREHLGKTIGDLSALKQPPQFITFSGQGLRAAPPDIDFPLGGGPDSGAGTPRKTHHLHASPVYWKGADGAMLFDWGENEALRAWKIDPTSGKLEFFAKGAELASRALALDDSVGGMTGGMISLSSDGIHNGIVWTLAPLDGNANTAVVEGVVRAYDAANLDPAGNADGSPRLKLLWDSARSGVKFHFSKFCPPMVADGKLFVPTYDGRVDVYAPRF